MNHPGPSLLRGRVCFWANAQVWLAVASLLAMGVYAAVYLFHSHPPRDPFGYVLGRDFVNTWMGAKTVLAGGAHDVLQVDHHIRRLVDALGPMPPHNWSYPPVLFLFVWPLGFLTYMPALAAWSAVGLAAYLGAAATFGKSAKYLLFAAAVPAIAITLYSGQTGFFTAAILILVFRFLDERPLAAGAILGLMLFKPHLAILFPLALAVSGRWRAFAAAAISAAALIALTALVFGASIWSEYFRLVVPVQRGVLYYGTGFLSMMPTAFMHARLLGASSAIAWAVQVPFTLLALGAVVFTFARRRDPVLSAGVLLTAGLIATPYAFAYDMVTFGWLAALLWPRLDNIWDRLLLIAVWSLPATMIALGDADLPLAAPILAIFLIRLTFLARRGICPDPASLLSPARSF
jgi:hypothetical protein